VHSSKYSFDAGCLWSIRGIQVWKLSTKFQLCYPIYFLNTLSSSDHFAVYCYNLRQNCLTFVTIPCLTQMDFDPWQSCNCCIRSIHHSFPIPLWPCSDITYVYLDINFMRVTRFTKSRLVIITHRDVAWLNNYNIQMIFIAPGWYIWYKCIWRRETFHIWLCKRITWFHMYRNGVLIDFVKSCPV